MTLLDWFRVQLDLKHWRLWFASFLALLWLPVLISLGEDWDGDGYDDDTGMPVGDPWSTDTDGDGLYDGEESMGFYIEVPYFMPDPAGTEEHEGEWGYWYTMPDMVYTDPYDADTDGDLLPDGHEVWDQDLHPTDPSDGNSDTDFDGLTRGEEYQEGTYWDDDDSDDDTYLDGEEVLLLLTNPMDASDPGSGGGGDPGGGDPGGGDPGGGGVNPLDNGGGNGLNFGDRDSDGLPDWWEFRHFGGTERVSAAGSEDANGNGIPDGDEDHNGNPDGSPDGIPDGDLDQDGLYNIDEFNEGTDPYNADSDDDGLDDGDEINGIDRANSGGTETLFGDPLNPDSDGDNYRDGWEYANGLYPQDSFDTDPSNLTDGMPAALSDYYAFLGMPLDPMGDEDGDGLNNGMGTTLQDGSDTGEFLQGTDPFDSDTDDDGRIDGDEIFDIQIDVYVTEWDNSVGEWVEVSNTVTFQTDPTLWDTDDDGYGDGFEVSYGSNPADDTSRPILSYADTDGDWLWDFQEAMIGTYPNDADSDDDGATDGEEYYLYGTDPLDPNDFWVDTDGDGISDETEERMGTDPNNADTDNDGFEDGQEVYWHETDPLDDTHYWEDVDQDGLRDDTEAVLEATLGFQSTTRDSDGDGLSDSWEFYNGPNHQVDAVHSDTDGIPDAWEEVYGLNPADPADGTENWDTDDFDNLAEFQNGTNPWSTDSDGDLLSDSEEVNDHGTNPLLWDTDGDGQGDGMEINHYNTLPLDPNSFVLDTDGDWMPDAWEIANNLDANDDTDWRNDPDTDGLINWWEYTLGTDPQDDDSDGDNLLDGEEAVDGIEILDTAGNVIDRVWTNPALADSDGDGVNDDVEIAQGSDPNDDTDGGQPGGGNGGNPPPADSEPDGMTDSWEVAHGLNPTIDDSGLNPDNDGLTNLQEFLNGTDPQDDDSDDDGLIDGDEIGGIVILITTIDPVTGDEIQGSITVTTNPNEVDTDGDGIDDGVEVALGMNPASASDGNGDSDGDGLSDSEEIALGTDPDEIDTDGDGIGDGREVNGFMVFNNSWTSYSVYVTNPLEADTDGDGIDDGVELISGTHPASPTETGTASIIDNNVNGLPDDWEVHYAPDFDPGLGEDAFLGEGNDYDGDGLTNIEEFQLGTDPTLIDTDGDTLPDGEEVIGYFIEVEVEVIEEMTEWVEQWNEETQEMEYVEQTIQYTTTSTETIEIYTNPANADTDGDLVPDNVELERSMRPDDPVDGEVDDDYDQLSYGLEYVLGTEYDNPDTDGDGMWDGWEVFHGFDPLDPNDGILDEDGDGISNADEYANGTNPLGSAPSNWNPGNLSAQDSDGDGVNDATELRHGTDPNDGGDFLPTINPLQNCL